MKLRTVFLPINTAKLMSVHYKVVAIQPADIAIDITGTDETRQCGIHLPTIVRTLPGVALNGLLGAIAGFDFGGVIGLVALGLALIMLTLLVNALEARGTRNGGVVSPKTGSAIKQAACDGPLAAAGVYLVAGPKGAIPAAVIGSALPIVPYFVAGSERKQVAESISNGLTAGWAAFAAAAAIQSAGAANHFLAPSLSFGAGFLAGSAPKLLEIWKPLSSLSNPMNVLAEQKWVLNTLIAAIVYGAVGTSSAGAVIIAPTVTALLGRVMAQYGSNRAAMATYEATTLSLVSTLLAHQLGSNEWQTALAAIGSAAGVAACHFGSGEFKQGRQVLVGATEGSAHDHAVSVVNAFSNDTDDTPVVETHFEDSTMA